MNDCIFCQIIAGNAESSIAYEDDLVTAIIPIEPINPGHTIIMAREHCPQMQDMDEATGRHLFKITLRMQQAVRNSAVKCEGINLWLCDGKAASQDVFHLHMHVIPRYRGDGFKVKVDWPARPSREELDETARHIGDAYRSLWGDAAA